jgi:cytidylate kinase
MPGTITISASYGAQGDKIGRALAERLGLPFLERVIPAAVARQLDLAIDADESLDEPVPSLWERIVATFANTATPIGPSPMPVEEFDTPERFRSATEATLRQVADTTGAVILGRAGMVALGGRPDVVCVRLDGPVEARIAQAVATGIDEESARHSQRQVDRARDTYARVFFNARQDDARLYHLILDSTAFSTQGCVDMIARAAEDRLNRVTS